MRFAIDAGGFYPVEVSPAWVPATVPALLTDRHTDRVDEPLAVTGSDGVERPASEAGRLVLLPAMPDDSALVDLDAVTRGAVDHPRQPHRDLDGRRPRTSKRPCARRWRSATSP